MIGKKAALAYAEAITWDLPATKSYWIACTNTSASRSWSRSVTSSLSQWASSAGCGH